MGYLPEERRGKWRGWAVSRYRITRIRRWSGRFLRGSHIGSDPTDARLAENFPSGKSSLSERLSSLLNFMKSRSVVKAGFIGGSHIGFVQRFYPISQPDIHTANWIAAHTPSRTIGEFSAREILYERADRVTARLNCISLSLPSPSRSHRTFPAA